MKKLLQLEKEWNEAAKALVEARQNYHKAEIEKQKAVERHRQAKQAYLVEKDKELGIEGED